MNPWVSHVKKYALDHNLSYKEALKEAKDSYDNTPEKTDIIKGSGQTQGRTARIHPSNQFDPMIQEQLTAYIVETARGHGPLSSLGRLRSLDRRVRNGRADASDLETYQELYQNFLNNDTIDDISIDIE
jgi:hypothetical protein